ncbi:MAG: hypothetical protein ABIG11_08925, partial [bacterium]
MGRPILITGFTQLLTFTGDKSARSGKKMRETGLVKNGAVLFQDGIILAAGAAGDVIKHPLAA